MLGRHLFVSFVVVAVAAAACGSDDPVDPTGGTGGTGGMVVGTGGTGGQAPACGNGVVEAGEQCEPPNTSLCDANCMNVVSECTAAETYDMACATNTNGQWCWDGGMGGTLFCGCDPAFGNVDCQIDGFGRCDSATNRCVVTPDCGGDANEDNNDETMATVVTEGATTMGNTCVFDDDWFRFTATSTAIAASATWADDGVTDVDIAVSDCNGTNLGVGDSTDTSGELAVARELTPGSDYCVLLRAFGSPMDGAGDAAYSLVLSPRTSCTLDSACTGPEVCPAVGSEAGVCTPSAPVAPCGDDVAGDNDTSGNAEVLTSGVTITESICDGGPNGPGDVDWFTFTVAAGEAATLSVNQAGGLADGDVDYQVYDATGELWAVRATVDNPEVLSVAGLPAGTYFVLASYYDNDPNTPASVSYDITVTLTAGTGCSSRDDCALLLAKGECTAGVCGAFEGNMAQGPGQFCDSSDDCDPATTGSQFLNGLCFSGDPTLGTDNVCVMDCTTQAECEAVGMKCAIIQNNQGVCLAPCTSDAGCGGLQCDANTGICSQP